MVEVGQIVSSKYKLLRLLGDGGMGSVYEAEHLRLGTHVAIKVLHSELARKSGLVERFLQEARVSAQIRSPHVVHVTDVESTPDGIAYLVMELLQGEPLSNVERRERTLSVGTACEYTIQILRALEAAHSLGVIHRDLKPDNVFVTFEGGRPVLKLIDFGIAKLKQDTPGVEKKNLTVAGMLMGTPEYMAPEQAYSADKVDVRADLYAVGVMLYEMLAGTTPATGADPRIVVGKVERGEVTPLITAAPNVPREVAGLVHRAMAPRPEMRFASATEMRLALEGAVSGKKPPTGLMPAMGGLGGPSVAPFQGSVAPQQGSVAPFQGSVAPFQGSVAPFQGSVAPAAGSAPEVGTGTVMGAPAEGALAPNARPGTGTVGAAPLQTRELQGPNPHVMTPGVAIPPMQPMQPSYRPPTAHEPPRKGGAGLVVALAIVALLLGAGAVVTYVMSTTPSTPPPPDPFATGGTVQTLTTPATTTAPPPPTTPTPPVTPLQPGPQPQPQPQPQPKVDAGAAPPKTDAGAAPSNTVIPPFPPFPSAFPSGFPSAIPLPSGFPSAIPLPSGFPPIFPPTPPPQK